MIQVHLTNEMLKRIVTIEKNKASFSVSKIPVITQNKLRKNSKKKKAFSSNLIEGNPLSASQAYEVIDSDMHKHFLKPEQEILNYYLALNLLEERLEKHTPLTVDLILEVQALVEKGVKDKIGLRGATPPGVLFAVYDSGTGKVDYIPPEYTDIPDLLDELVTYVNTTDDHPLIVASIVHYQLVTIHPFLDGNGRTARLISGYILDLNGFSFGGIGSLEEYFAYDVDEYYDCIQMGLPPLYYEGRDNPPHPEIWVHYFLRMVELYSNKAFEIMNNENNDVVFAGLSYLNKKEKELLSYILRKNIISFTPIELSKELNITNKTIINHCAKLASYGFIIPKIVNKRIRTYQLSDFSKINRDKLLESIRDR